MKTARVKYILLLILGFLSILAGGFVFGGKWSGTLIGLGAGTVGVAVSQLVTHLVMERNPALRRRERIEQNDERNIQINNSAKAKAFTFSQFLALPLFLVLVLVGVELGVILMVVGVYVINWIVYLRALSRLMREG